MPGPALHHMIADRLRAQISLNKGLGSKMTTDQYVALQKLLADNNNLPYLFFGCQGPDYLFFNTKDMPGPIGDLAEFYFEVADFIEKFKKTLLAVVPQPVLDALQAFDETVDEIIEDSVLLSELQQTFKDINRLLDGFSATLIEMTKKFISNFNLFDQFPHPYRDGLKKDDKWWWFDALHYRKTGKFTKALLDATSGNYDDPKILYALGYLTHYCADTVGHPYVNLISGGPYRSHAQRHKTGENYQDVFNFLNETGTDWNRSKLHEFYKFNLNAVDTENNESNEFSDLPDKLAELIADSIKKVYQEDGDSETEYGLEITPEDVNNAYRLFYKWLKNSTDTGTLPEPVPYSFSAELREVWEQTMDNLEDAGDFLENAIDNAGGFGLLGIFVVFAAIIIASAMAAAAIADGIAGAIATTGTATIRATACLIYEKVYNAYQTFRLSVAMNGLAFPMKEHLSEPRLTQFANPANNDPAGVNAAPFVSLLPLLKFRATNIYEILFNQERHLTYPFTQNEKNHVMGTLNSYLTETSIHYAFGKIPFAPEDILDRLAGLTPDVNPINNDDGTQLKELLLHRGSLGNAMTLIEKSHERFQDKKDLIDFNLDGDRGYSYLCWTQHQDELDPPNFPEKLKVNVPGGNPIDNNINVKLKFLK